jgi:hypothetical protein
MILPQGPDLTIEKDIHGVIRELRHLQKPAEAEPGDSARHAALEYLKQASARRLLPLTDEDLHQLETTIESGAPRRSGTSRFRWAEPRELKRHDGIESTIVWCQQIVAVGDSRKDRSAVAFDVQGSSIRLVVHHKPGGVAQITSARLTTLSHGVLSVKPVDVKKRLGELAPDWADDFPADRAMTWLGPVLGLDSSDGITECRLVGYHDRARASAEGDLTLAISATVFMPTASGHEIAHRVVVDVLSDRLLRKAPIASGCAGYAFLNDPDSKTGGFALRPDSGTGLLDPQRDPVALLDLDHIGGGGRKLSGPRLRLRQQSALGREYDPPQQVPPFAFSVRTNEFAAVSAYCHCDSMVQLIEGFGFPLRDRCNNRAMSLTVEHRAKLLSGPGARDGRGINAYVTPFKTDKTKPLDVTMLFGLADFSDSWKHPLGLAADVRFVWHEFCHVLILAATGSTEFDFAHSAGDALAAIMCDPTSKLPDAYRGVTFPFIQLPLRRHNRNVEDGWGWYGTQYERPDPTYGLRDPVGYNAEQILSSTLFRLYCALGGDAVHRSDGQPDVERRTATAYYCAYLIVRAIASLGCIETEPTREASQFATALMEADIGTPDLDYEGSKRLGGLVHKVVRWAFERQGLREIAPAGTRDEPGPPPAIDIYVDDGRHGKYDYRSNWHALPAVLWVSHHAGGGTPGQTPRPGHVNHVHVILHNRGDQPAIAASVDVFAAVGNATETWDATPGYWQKLPRNNATHDVPNGHQVTFGPFDWTPQAGAKNALLVRATAAGDLSNIDDNSNLPCAIGPVPVEDLVRADNNLGYREWTL